MFRHIALFEWKPGTTEAERQAVRDALAALPGQIAEIVSYHFGDDAAVDTGNFAFAVTADFASRAGYFVYRDHPAHQKVVTELVRPIVASRAAVQFELEA